MSLRMCVAAAVVSAAAVTGAVAAPSIVAEHPAAVAAGETVENSRSSESSISVRILQRNGVVINRIVGPDNGVAAGADDITSYLIPKKVCGSVNRGGVNIGTFAGPKRTGVAHGERIHVLAWPMVNGRC